MWDSWEHHLQPLKNQLRLEQERERSEFEAVKSQLLRENVELQRRLTNAQNEVQSLKKQLEVRPEVQYQQMPSSTGWTVQPEQLHLKAANETPTPPTPIRIANLLQPIANCPPTPISPLSSLDTCSPQMKELQGMVKKIVGTQIPHGPKDCPDYAKNIPESKKLWNALDMGFLDKMTYIGMRNVLFWIMIVARQPCNKIAVEILRLRKIEEALKKEEQSKAQSRGPKRKTWGDS